MVSSRSHPSLSLFAALAVSKGQSYKEGTDSSMATREAMDKFRAQKSPIEKYLWLRQVTRLSSNGWTVVCAHAFAQRTDCTLAHAMMRCRLDNSSSRGLALTTRAAVPGQLRPTL